jgi:hypothetical protein
MRINDGCEPLGVSTPAQGVPSTASVMVASRSSDLNGLLEAAACAEGPECRKPLMWWTAPDFGI